MKMRSARGQPEGAAHTLVAVYTEMMAQCMMDYRSLPDVRTLEVSEIAFFYRLLSPGIVKRQKQAEQMEEKAKTKSPKR